MTVLLTNDMYFNKRMLGARILQIKDLHFQSMPLCSFRLKRCFSGSYFICSEMLYVYADEEGTRIQCAPIFLDHVYDQLTTPHKSSHIDTSHSQLLSISFSLLRIPEKPAPSLADIGDQPPSVSKRQGESTINASENTTPGV